MRLIWRACILLLCVYHLECAVFFEPSVAQINNNDLYTVTEGGEDAEIVCLFLHGARFSSKTWQELGILTALADHVSALAQRIYNCIVTGSNTALRSEHHAGVKAVAVDLPGYGRSVDVKRDPQTLVRELFEKHARPDQKTVLVSPSMSGAYALPYLSALDPATQHPLSCFVALAPVGIPMWDGNLVNAEVRSTLKVLAMYGERDVLRRDVSKLEELFEHIDSVIIPGAPHACYMYDRQRFYDEMLAMMAKLTKTSYVAN